MTVGEKLRMTVGEKLRMKKREIKKETFRPYWQKA
jgi:hypothetical protein